MSQREDRQVWNRRKAGGSREHREATGSTLEAGSWDAETCRNSAVTEHLKNILV